MGQMNWLELFHVMLDQLDVNQQRDMYNVLAMIRGPDKDEPGYYRAKELSTARIRALLFKNQRVVPGDINTDGEPLTVKELSEFPVGHYRSHATDAQIALVRLGIWKTESYRDENSQDDDIADDDDSDDDDDSNDWG